MKTKEKIIILTVILIVSAFLYCIYSMYDKKNLSYAVTSTEINEVEISRANKLEIDEIIQNNIMQDLEQIISEDVELEYITEYRSNNELPKGEIKVIQEGRTGLQQTTIKKIYDESGELKKEEQINSIIIKSPVNKIVEIGINPNKKVSTIFKGNTVYVTSDRAEIMKENNIMSEKITTVTKNQKMVVIEEKNNWYKIDINGLIGWIKDENISNINPNMSEEDEFIDNETIFITPLSFDMPLNKPSGFTLEQFKKMLSDSKDKNNIFSQNAEYFYYIEKQYNINGVFVAAIGIHESAWGTSNISLKKKNLFGYGAYDSSPYNSSFDFSTYSEGIDLIARVLIKYYLNIKGTPIYNGELASGKYYYGDTISDVNKKYASDKNWAKKVYNNMEYLYEKIKK